ncbi:MAG: flagellar basal body-associated FliL family protein [Halanaerobacter sp.]
MADGDNEANEKDNGLNLTLIIAVVLSVVLATGASYFMMMKFGGLGNNGEEDNGKESQKKEVEELGPTHDLEQFLVNLSGSNSYVKLKISVEVDNEKVIEEIEDRSPQIRDIIISILRSKEMEDVQKSPAAKALRSEIRTKINENLAKGKITNIFFTEFVIQ